MSNKPKVNAWLVTNDRKSYQLNQGDTVIGRANQSDIVVENDTTVSSSHIKITEQNGSFRLIDLGSRNGTKVNGTWVRSPVQLEHDDEICLGDRTVFRFTASSRMK